MKSPFLGSKYSSIQHSRIRKSRKHYVFAARLSIYTSWGNTGSGARKTVRVMVGTTDHVTYVQSYPRISSTQTSNTNLQLAKKNQHNQNKIKQ